MIDKKLVHDLADVIMDVKEAGDYADLELGKYGSCISVRYAAGGFDTHKKYDLCCEAYSEEGIERVIKCFRGILKEKDPGRGNSQSQVHEV